jgi:predicted transcriptional regulator
MGSCEDAIAHVFGLGKCERGALSFLCRKEGGAKELARACGKSCPRMAQVLSGLREKGLVKRRKILLSRGYKYAYSASPRKELARQARRQAALQMKMLLAKLKQ